jgi:geranylgeranyl reductase family protein
MNSEKFDVTIIGAGPAGCACALMLADSGLNIAIIDKGISPKEKICGNALSKDVINQLEKFPLQVKNNFDKITEKIPSSGIRFYSPKSECLEISFEQAGKKDISGFICKRRYLDEILINSLKEYSNIKLFESTEVKDISIEAEDVIVSTATDSFHSKIIVGADGANSLVVKELGDIEKDKNSLCLGLRGYFENVTGFHPGNFIELHFYKEVLPEYIWIFPMANNTANVGIGMLATDVSNKKINLKSILEKFISVHPGISPRFKDAKQTGKFEAWGIPLGTKKRKISGERFLLAGDAASLVDPFTGEGIGNALRSGRIAADHIKDCFKKNRFDDTFNAAYDNEIYRRMWKELKLSNSIQKLFKHPKLINYAVRKAIRNEHFKSLIADAMTNEDIKKNLVRPYLFYKTFIR